MSGLGRLWPFRARPEREAGEALLSAVVAASRSPSLYGPERLPDEMEARFESAVVHAVLALIRLKDEAEARGAAQEFTDGVFRWFDSGLYEAGVGYQKVPKEMRALAARFYGRLEAYAQAIAAEDAEGLAAALARNVMRAELERWPFARDWAAHCLALVRLQAGAPWRDLASPALWPPLA